MIPNNELDHKQLRLESEYQVLSYCYLYLYQLYDCIILYLLQCDVDCLCTSWVNEGTCSLECGGGDQKQTRSCTEPSGQGEACPPERMRNIPCNTQEVHIHRFNFIVINSELGKHFIQIIHIHNVILITTKMDDIGWHG